MKLEPCVGLCHRCENRVKNIETEKRWQPRMECGMHEGSVHSCYAYRPVKPIVMRKTKGDTRPFGYRTQAEGVPECELLVKVMKTPKGKAKMWVRYWGVK